MTDNSTVIPMQRIVFPMNQKELMKEENVSWGPIGKEVYNRTYSRTKPDGTQETWADTVERVVDGNLGLVPRKHHEPEERRKLLDLIYKMDMLPAGRHLWSSGVPGRQFLFNCVQGNTLVMTKEGILPIHDLVGRNLEVLSMGERVQSYNWTSSKYGRGVWRKASFQSFGKQKLFRVLFSDGSHVEATDGHRWYITKGRDAVTTGELLGREVPFVCAEKPARNTEYTRGILHGFTYGDGAMTSAKGSKSAEVRMFGGKHETMEGLFEISGYDVKHRKDCDAAVGRLPRNWKDLPEAGASSSYWLGFICGMIAADGTVDKKGSVYLYQSDREALDLIRWKASEVGFACTEPYLQRRVSPYSGEESPCWRIAFRRFSVDKDDLVLDHHQENFVAGGPPQVQALRVTAVEDTGREEEVYCAVEPETHSFVLGNGLLTGNCHATHFSRKDLAAHFTFLFDELMKGGGVGSNYSNKHIELCPPVFSKVDFHVVCNPAHPNYAEFNSMISRDYGHHSPDRFVIDDSREGWCASLSEVLLAAWHGKDTPLIIDVSMLREKGALLKSFGGKSSGPAPLVTMLTNVARIMNTKVGHKLSSLDIMAIDHEIATCVVSGNIRRSARMSIKHWADKDIADFIHCKADEKSHWSTNISVEVDDEFFRCLRKGEAKAKKVLHEVVDGVRKNGEPGLWNSSLSSVGEVETPCTTNPCGEIALAPWENCFSGDEKFITKEYGAVSFSEMIGQTVTVQTPSGWKPAVVSSFGNQNVQKVTFAPARRNTGAEGYQETRSLFRVEVIVTKNHRWEKVDGKVTSSLGVGDVIPMNAASFEKNEDYESGVQHGIIFGDGCADRQYADGEWRHRVRLFGGKAKEMAGYFDHLTYPKSCKGAPEDWLKTSLNLKELPDGTEGSDYLAGFLAGWGMADANERPNGSLHLGSSHPEAEEWLMRNAASAGWVLRGAKDSGTSETNYGQRKNRLKFFTLSRPDNKDLAWQVESIEEMSGKIPVYCATVPGVERFTLASGIATMNCNLGHVNLERFAGRDVEAKEAFRLMARFLVRATFGDVLSEYQKAVQSKNRRIGVGFFGFHSWLVYQGVRFSESHHNREIREKLKTFHGMCREEARKYAFELRMPEPIKVTTIAPTGTISNLPGTTSGCQPIFAKYFKRRVNYASNDSNLKDLEVQGFPIEDSVYTKNTKVVTFFCKDPLVDACERRNIPLSVLEEQTEISVSDHLSVQSMLQREYADNGISYTINCPADVSAEEIIQALKVHLPHLKGTTLMPEGESRAQTPLERITKEEFEEAEKKGLAKVSDAERACLNGACPVK